MNIIDRFEGDIAVIETDDETIEADRSELPEEAIVGDVIVCKDGKWEVDKEITGLRRNEMRKKMRILMGLKHD